MKLVSESPLSQIAFLFIVLWVAIATASGFIINSQETKVFSSIQSASIDDLLADPLPENLGKILTFSESSDRHTRHLAIVALRHYSDKSASQRLIEILGDKDNKASGYASQSLLFLGPKVEKPIIEHLRMLQSEYSNRLNLAIKRLEPYSEQVVVKKYLDLLCYDDDISARNRIDLLNGLPERVFKAVNHFVTIARQNRNAVVEGMMVLRSGVGGEYSQEELYAAIQSNEIGQDFRAEALKTIAKIGGSKANEIIGSEIGLISSDRPWYYIDLPRFTSGGVPKETRKALIKSAISLPLDIDMFISILKYWKSVGFNQFEVPYEADQWLKKATEFEGEYRKVATLEFIEWINSSLAILESDQGGEKLWHDMWKGFVMLEELGDPQLIPHLDNILQNPSPIMVASQSSTMIFVTRARDAIVTKK